MARKRKSRNESHKQDQARTEDTFPDSEDEFYAGKDRILLDEGPQAKRRRKLEQEMRDLQPSDEEILAIDEDEGAEDDDDTEIDQVLQEDGDEEAEDDDEENDDAYWGSSKADYYNADVIETEQDALEEAAEARRLRQKQLKRMTDADFGFDELQWKDDEQNNTAKKRTVEKLPPLQIPETATEEQRLDILRNRYPEFEPLSEDLLDVHEVHEHLKKQPQKSRLLVTKIRASGAYMAAIAMYLAILTSTKDGLALPPQELREHPIMDSLLRCRQLWEAVKDLEEEVVPEILNGQPDLNATAAQLPMPAVNGAPANGKAKKNKKARIVERSPTPDSTSDGLYDLDALAPVPNNISLSTTKPGTKVKKADISDLLSKAAAVSETDSASDFGDESSLTHEEASEKARKKKSLRFYTNQIAQKATKRGAKSREAGGDDDIPYKERIKDKQARERREAEKERQKQPDLDAFDDGSDDGLANAMNDDANTYYNTIVSQSKSKKTDKQARATAYAEAARQGAQIYEEATVGPDGKRKITYAIEKNKGLAPKRKKEVRNPRVKKKKKYEEKMKKLGSIRQVYKGGEGRGGYGGELTGIKTNVVKSVKL